VLANLLYYSTLIMLASSSFLSYYFKNLYHLIYIYLAIFHFWYVVQCIRHLSLWVSMSLDGSQHLYFSKTLSFGMMQIQIQGTTLKS